MDELTEIKEMLSDHMKQSDENMNELKQSMARIEVHGEYTKEKLASHDNTIGELKSAHNKQKGAMFVLSIIGLGGLEELIRNWIK